VILPTVADILDFHQKVLLPETGGGLSGVRDHDAIQAALDRAWTSAGGEFVFGDVFEKTAAIVESLVGIRHPFVDGNKRTGAVVTMRYPRHAPARPYWLLPVTLLLFSCYCQIGGGYTDDSATVDGQDGTRVLAESQGAGTLARLEFFRETREIKGGHEIRYLFPKTRITQTLTVVINDSGEPNMRFVVADRNAASSYDSHLLKVSPDGEHIAYKLGDEPWRFIHVVEPGLVFHGPTEQTSVRWDDLPDLAGDGFMPLFEHQEERGEDWNVAIAGRQGALVQWFRQKNGSDEAYAKLVFDLVPKRDLFWSYRVDELSDSGRAHLEKLVRDEIARGTPDSEYFAVAVEEGFVDLESAPADLVRRGTSALAAYDPTFRDYGTDIAEYLRVHAKHDLDSAAQLACEIVGREPQRKHHDLPYSLDDGRPLALVSLAIIARSGKPCRALKGWRIDPCKDCGGPCSPTGVEEDIERVLTTPITKPEGIGPVEPETAAKLVVAADKRTCDG
jgi:hypothetical protein